MQEALPQELAYCREVAGARSVGTVIPRLPRTANDPRLAIIPPSHFVRAQVFDILDRQAVKGWTRAHEGRRCCLHASLSRIDRRSTTFITVLSNKQCTIRWLHMLTALPKSIIDFMGDAPPDGQSSDHARAQIEVRGGNITDITDPTVSNPEIIELSALFRSITAHI